MSLMPAALQKMGLGKILKRVFALVGSRFAGSFLTLLYTLIIAKIATPEDFGLAMLGLSFALLVSIPLSLNVEGGSIKYLVAYLSDGDVDSAAGFLRFNRRLLLGLSGLGFGVLFSAQIVGWIDLSSEVGRVYLLSGLTAPFLAATRVYGRHATALDEVLRGSLPRMLVRPALFCCILGFMWMTGQRVTADFVAGVFLFTTVMTALLQAWLLRATFAELRSETPKQLDWRSWLKTGVMLAPLVLMRENLKNIIIVAAGFVLVKSDIGLLALALSILAIIIFAVKAVDIAVSPKLSKQIQADQRRDAMFLIGVSGCVKLIGTIVGLGLIAIGGGSLLGLFGDQYLPAQNVVLILFVIPIANAVFGPVDLVLNVTGNRAAILSVSVWSIAILALGTIFGGWVGGLIGAAWGAVVPYVVGQIGLCVACIRHAQLDPSLRSLLHLRGRVASS